MKKLNASIVGPDASGRPYFEGMTKNNQKGITLIALIITIIVMLILVGVTINVALNGGLFQKAETATYQTEAILVKEQLEIAKTVAIANNGGKLLDDYSSVAVENLSELDEKTKNKFKNKILVNSDGDICYNPENVTDEERSMLEAIGINAYEKNELTEEEIAEIVTLIMQYATALESNNTVAAQEAKNELLQKGVNLDEFILVSSGGDALSTNYYFYCHNKKIMLGADDLSIKIPSIDEIEILDELYNIAECFDNELDTNGFPEDTTSITVIYNGETIRIHETVDSWNYTIEPFSLRGYDLDKGGRYRGI